MRGIKLLFFTSFVLYIILAFASADLASPPGTIYYGESEVNIIFWGVVVVVIALISWLIIRILKKKSIKIVKKKNASK